MCQLIETIKCLDGKLINLQYHQSRLNLARKAFYRHCGELSLAELITVPEIYSRGLFRCRVTYSGSIGKIEFFPHQYREIKSLKLVKCNDVDYRYKYADRKKLESLFEERGESDDILIVKNGFISDSFTANVVFFDGRKWWTPDTPLLSGTQRARLIYEKKLYPCPVTPDDLGKYTIAGLINAMQDLNDMPLVEISRITGS